MIYPIQQSVNTMFGDGFALEKLSLKVPGNPGYIICRFLDETYTATYSTTLSGEITSTEISILQFYRTAIRSSSADFPSNARYFVVDTASGGVQIGRNGLKDGTIRATAVLDSVYATLGTTHVQFPKLFSLSAYETAHLVLYSPTVSSALVIAATDKMGYPTGKGVSFTAQANTSYHAIDLGIQDAWGAIVYTPNTLYYDFTGIDTAPGGESRITANSSLYVGTATSSV